MTLLRLEADLHIHTLASLDAVSTFAEQVEAAHSRGLKAIAITEHGPALPNGVHREQFTYPTKLPAEYRGVRIYRGVEANILDEHGRLDLTGPELAALDLVVAGIHPLTEYSGTAAEENTRAVVAAMANPAVRLISHPHNVWFPVEMEAVVQAAAETGTWLELNARYLGSPANTHARHTARHMLTLCAEHGVHICVDSDAHFAASVGEFGEALACLAEMQFPAELVVTAQADLVAALLGAPKSGMQLQSEIEQRLHFLIQHGQLDAETLPVLRKALFMVERGLGKRLDGEGAVMFVTHMAAAVERGRRGDGLNQEMDPVVWVEVRSQPPSLFVLVDRLVALVEKELGRSTAVTEQALWVLHLAAYAAGS